MQDCTDPQNCVDLSVLDCINPPNCVNLLNLLPLTNQTVLELSVLDCTDLSNCVDLSVLELSHPNSTYIHLLFRTSLLILLSEPPHSLSSRMVLQFNPLPAGRWQQRLRCARSEATGGSGRQAASGQRSPPGTAAAAARGWRRLRHASIVTRDATCQCPPPPAAKRWPVAGGGTRAVAVTATVRASRGGCQIVRIWMNIE